jgi:hypothetical protein
LCDRYSLKEKEKEKRRGRKREGDRERLKHNGVDELGAGVGSHPPPI